MKKKFLIAALSAVFALSCAVGLAACNQKSNGSGVTDRDPLEGDADYVGDGPSQSSGLEFGLNDDGDTYSVTGIGLSADTDLTIPAKYQGKSVTEIAANAFNGSSIESVTLPDGLVKIGDGAFSASAELLSVNIPDSVKSIGEGAFQSCTGLMAVAIKSTSGLESIAGSAFQGCVKLRKITLPDSVTTLGGSAFRNCSELDNVEIGKNVDTIGERAFENCTSLKTLTIADGVKTISDSAFSGCSSLKEVSVPESVVKIGLGTFEKCSGLQSITLPFVGNQANDDHTDTSRKYGENNVALTHFAYIFGGKVTSTSDVNNVHQSVPESLETVKICGTSAIPVSSLTYCKYVKTIIIGDNITHIGNTAFAFCYSLETLVIGSGVTTIEADILDADGMLNSTDNKLYYNGTDADWTKISIDTSTNFGSKKLLGLSRYYYSETAPATSGYFWHYVDGVITEW